MIKDDIPIRLGWANTLYTNFTDEIRFYKNQQWLILLFVIGIQAGVYFLWKGQCPAVSFLIILSIIHVFIALLGLRAFGILQNGVERNRRYISNIKGNYITLSNMIGETAEERKEGVSARDDAVFKVIFATGVVLSLLVFLSLWWMTA